MWRLVFLAVVALGLAPGTWVRTPLKEPDFRNLLSITPVEAGTQKIGELDVLGLWELDSKNTHFGSYSALIMLDDGTLLAGSDRGRLLQFSPPGSTDQTVVRFTAFAGASDRDKDEVDLESLTRDPATGTIWAGYESSNAIARVSPELMEEKRVRPAEMRRWSSNSGPESLVRLADGRFLVIAEGNPTSDGSGIPALLFAGDPTLGGDPLEFQFNAPEGYRAVDAAQLPDGRVLVLVRRVAFGIPPGFEAALVLADPAEIDQDGDWSGQQIAWLGSPLPSDNFEGLAVVPQTDGGAILWMISDDNNGALQRTLLYKLRIPAGI
ncbi:esterase-like activity of phytase family protein [Sphingomonadaceae bacterium]|nr:esterase-like activity of phytase family protein [Sphingomonadaceae bacterium]